MKILLLLIAFLPLGQQGEARAAGASISFSEIIKSYRAKRPFARFEEKIREKANFQAEGASSFSPNPFKLGFEAEKGIGPNEERKISSSIKKSIVFGKSKAAAHEQYLKAGLAEIANAKLEYREQEQELYALYANLRMHQKSYRLAKESMEQLTPLNDRARAASKRGTLGGLSAKKLELFLGNVKIELEKQKRSYELAADFLSNTSGVKIDTDPNSSTLAPPEFLSFNREFSENNYLPVVAKIEEEKSLTAQIGALGKYEIEAGAGYSYDLQSKESVVSVGIEFPLGLGSAATSERNSLEADRKVLSMKREFFAEKSKQQHALLISETKSLKETESLLHSKVSSFEKLYSNSQKAFSMGQADLGEVVEVMKELFESKLELATTVRETEEIQARIELFHSGDAQ